MIKRILIAAVCFVSSQMIAQQTIIDEVNFDDQTILVGMASDYNTDNSYEKFNFFIDDASKLNAVKLNLEHGYEIENKVTDQNHFMIYAIKNKKIIDQWLVNPRLYNVFHNGIAYSFDADKLENISKNHPLKFDVEKKQFKNQKEYTKLKKDIEKDSSIFLIYEPDFTFEGSYEISLKKDDKIATAKDAEEYLRGVLKNYTKKNFVVSYALSEKNILDRSQFTMIIAGPKDIYEKMKLDNAEKTSWVPDVYEAVYVKKKFN